MKLVFTILFTINVMIIFIACGHKTNPIYLEKK
jgi:hypothetical protein